MKIKYCPWQSVILFEEGDRFAGKKLVMDGDSHPNGFLFLPKSMRWARNGRDDVSVPGPVTDGEREELIGYLIAEASKQGYEFIELVDPGDVK